ncbi:MAG: hypothetical protein AAB612_04785 [Patescibacteria group bacterium]
MFKLFLGAIVLTLVVGGGVFVAKNYNLIAENMRLSNFQNLLEKPNTDQPGDEQASIPDEKDGSILGVSKENITKTKGVVTNIVSPITNQVGNILGASVNTVTSVTSGSTTDNGKVDVNKLFENAKSQAAAIPEQVFTQARYEYCRQVVNDFEKQ